MALASFVSRPREDQKKTLKRLKNGHRQAPRPSRCAVEQLEDRTQPSAFAFAVMGDSLSTTYTGYRGSDGDKSWVQLLRLLRGNEVQIYDYAGNGAVSADAANTQSHEVANLVSQGTVHYSVLEIGGNDEKAYLNQIAAGIYTPFVNEVVANIESALNTVQQAGQVQQVLGLVPDIAFSPAVQNQLNHDPTKIANVLTATNMANQQLESYARAHGIVVIDTVGLGQLTQQPYIVMAGTQTSDYWSPDNFHSSGVMQGLWSNAVMNGFHEGYGAATTGLILSDQDILNNSGDVVNTIIHTPTYYNVQPFVILPPRTHTPALTAAPVDSGIANALAPALAVDGLGYIAATSLMAA